MPTIDFTRYYRYHEVVAVLHEFADTHPQFIALRTLGTSHEGRAILLATLTNRATGPDHEKPAFWLDANLHATEVTGCMGALHVLQYVLEHADDPAIKRQLDTRVLYILPCLNPDGMEQALTSPVYVRSGTRPYPYDEPRDGLYPADIDGDGQIVTMRVPDPDGGWKISAKDPRLMRRRQPDEEGGSYYRVYTEGLIRNYDGYEVTIAPATQGLDFNRNFPYIWAPEGKQHGAGPYPASEPEIRAVIHFLTTHLNVSCAITYHTYSGAILRPYSDKPDDQMQIDDLWTYKEIGARGQALTNYRHVSVYHGFRYHPRQVMRGAFDDWAYDQLGIFALTVELWDMISAAGIKDRDFIEWWRDHPEEDDLKLLAWSDEHTNRTGFIEWHPFDHPQLGPVEIGGWVERHTFGNPPPQFLQPTLEPNTQFVLAHARMTPCLELRELSSEHLGDNLYRLRAVVINTGYLPTYGSQHARDMHTVRPIEVSLTLPVGATLTTGKQTQAIGQLEGRANKRALWGDDYPTDHLRKLEWVVAVPNGGKILLTAASQRAGTVRGTIEL